jgi:alpha-L-fucosidase
MNKKNNRCLINLACLAAMLGLAQLQSLAAQIEILPGKFSGTAESLTNYSCPEWFRDAKFGIWAHWGPQAVPRAGDWYARNMYLQGSPQYESHLKNYGHPSTNGYKDIIPLWKAEKWDPDALMALYVKAGAKYFVSMGVHHDNFDLWNSKFHSWNAMKMGPHRDIVGDWKRAAEKHGMRFGVSEHLGPSFGWFAPSHGYDQFWEPGAKLGVPYDGADPKFQELYHPANNEPFRWGPSWYATNSAWHQEWFNRIKDLLDQYQPDLLYTDGGIPFGEVGRSLLAHFYNSNEAAHGGKLEAVYNFKDLGTGEFIRQAGVEDVERGVMPGINPLPWQTCTSMGDWFYSDGFKYKTTAEVVRMLADIVSKNGNLLLNVVLYADGSLPPESRQFLDEMAVWMAVNGEAIYGTRPWKIFGEGPTVAAAGFFKEDTTYTPQDIRFTTKEGRLYAISLGWPAEGKVVITSLAKNDDASVNQIERIELLGGKGELKFTQTAAGLTVELPAQKISDIACTLKITGSNLQPVKSSAPAAGILTPPTPDAPRINGANVFGVRPGSPFLFNIPATGKRPMKFSAKGLPKGLKLDATTGRITGSFKKTGEFAVRLRAKNAFGSAEKNFRIVVGERIALTPPLGWNTYNCWGDSRAAAQKLRATSSPRRRSLPRNGLAGR